MFSLSWKLRLGALSCVSNDIPRGEGHFSPCSHENPTGTERNLYKKLADFDIKRLEEKEVKDTNDHKATKIFVSTSSNNGESQVLIFFFRDEDEEKDCLHKVHP